MVVLVELGVVAGDERAGGLACGSREDGSDEGEGGCEDDGGLHCCVAVMVVTVLVVAFDQRYKNKRNEYVRRNIDKKQECQKRCRRILDGTG